jgi:hypothetical protein
MAVPHVFEESGNMRRVMAAAGSAVGFVVGPGLVAGLVPRSHCHAYDDWCAVYDAVSAVLTATTCSQWWTYPGFAGRL